MKKKTPLFEIRDLKTKMAAPFKKTSARHLQPRVDVKVTPDTLYWKNLDVCIFIILLLLSLPTHFNYFSNKYRFTGNLSEISLNFLYLQSVYFL